jgi:hypothetical protein
MTATADHLGDPPSTLIRRRFLTDREDPAFRLAKIGKMAVNGYISLHRFIKGIKLPNIHPYPYFAVSNVSPGVQVADVFAHLLSKRVQKKEAVMDLFRELMQLQWVSKRTKPQRFGFIRFEERFQGGERTYRIRTKW